MDFNANFYVEKALELLKHKTEERMKHTLTGEQILSLEDVNEVLLMAGMPLISKENK